MASRTRRAGRSQSTIYDWVRAFTPRFIEAARSQRAPLGGRWRYLFRAIDEHGQIVDVYLSDHRDTAAARAFFEEAIHTSDVTPTEVTTDKAKCYPSALGAVVPLTQHRRSKYLNNPLERDHQHLKGRVRSMRRFKNVGAASNFCGGHALIRNLAGGYWPLTVEVAPRLRVATVWSALGAAL